MRTSIRRALLGSLSAIIILALAAVLLALSPTRTRVIAAAVQPDPAMIERGRYLAIASDCTACHTRCNGPLFAGGLPIASPIGVIFSTNITPDRESGIGAYSLADFDRAVRHGIAPRNITLYPAMPYPSYAHMTDPDIVALYAYFMYGVPPVRAQNRRNEIPWPLSIRWPLAIWRKAFAPNPDAVVVYSARYKDPIVARGAYLVQGPGHCGSCHTPRALTLQEKALDDSNESYLGGGQVIDGWLAVNLRGNRADGLGGWSDEQIIATLRSARDPVHAVTGGAMSDVVVHSTQYLNDADLRAVASYLKTLPPDRHPASSFAADPATARALAVGEEAGRGAQLYDDNCAACHHTDGRGATRALPAIAGNSSVLAADPTSIIHLILQGSQLPGTAAAPSPLGMPGFGWRLSDQEVAELGTFIRRSWGNHAPAIAPEQVRHLRETLARPP
jgi:alcohol dehydrogenase (quinone), cytochrome c subunit